jgi:hypothetical protein
MKVSPEFLTDLRYLSAIYAWTEAMKKHVRESVKAHPNEFIQFLSSLAAAHRKGYEESEGRGLAVWCATNGVAHPYVGELEETED